MARCVVNGRLEKHAEWPSFQRTAYITRHKYTTGKSRVPNFRKHRRTRASLPKTRQAWNEWRIETWRQTTA
eukprot:9986120-Lingulodinium_polyedra.AAC.1